MNQDIEHTNDETKLFMSLALSGQKDIYVYILSFVFSTADAEDILQDTLSIMWRKFSEFESGTNFVAWGKQIARYRVMDYLRKNKGSKLCYDSDVVEIIESKAGQGDDFSDYKKALKKCLRKLSEKSLAMLNMRYAQDMPYRQIAVRYGISKQSLYRSISRLHVTLLKCIKHSIGKGELHGS